MNFSSLAIAKVVFKRTWLKTLRRPVALTFSLMQPLMWMLFFGFLFHRYSLDEMPAGISYLDFLVPGICAMTVLFGASQSGIELIRDMQTQFLNRVLSTPASKTMLMVGKVGADTSRLIIQSCLVLFLALALGAKLQLSILPLCHMMNSLILFSIAFCSLSCFIALKAQSQENMATFVHLVNMPMLFTSTALVPSKQMPDWLARIAQFNPLSLVVNNSREALLFNNTPEIQSSILPLFIMATLLFLLTSYTLRSIQLN
ncbi:MAG: ABC transporter permease [Methylococcales bacterium]|nr:ABC transporter permease [Methylococcales bacterium]